MAETTGNIFIDDKTYSIEKNAFPDIVIPEYLTPIFIHSKRNDSIASSDDLFEKIEDELNLLIESKNLYDIIKEEKINNPTYEYLINYSGIFWRKGTGENQEICKKLSYYKKEELI